MAFSFVYAGTRQPLPAGARVYGLELGPDKLPKAAPFRTDVGAGGVPGALGELGYPKGLPRSAAAFAPVEGGQYQVIAIPAAQDFGSPAEAYQALRRCPPLSFAEGRMPAVMVSGLRPDQQEPPHAGGHVVRFRATAQDGEELVSSAISLRDAGPGPRLALARFDEKQARCGGLCTLRVFVRGLEGSSVRFEVESGDGSAWKPLGSAGAEVKSGEAVAQFLLPAALLPAAKSADEAGKPGTKLRFQAIAEFENLLSAELPILPPPMVVAPPAAKPAPANNDDAPAAKPAPAAAPVAAKPAPAAVAAKPAPAAVAAKPAPPPVAAKPAPAAVAAKPAPAAVAAKPAPPPVAAKPAPAAGKAAPATSHKPAPSAAKPAPAAGKPAPHKPAPKPHGKGHHRL